MTTAARSTPRSPTIVLVFLLLAYILNFLDRQILGILLEPIKTDLKFTDSELGILTGPAFAVPGIAPSLGFEGVVTGFYGAPRQVFLSLDVKF